MFGLFLRLQPVCSLCILNPYSFADSLLHNSAQCEQAALSLSNRVLMLSAGGGSVPGESDLHAEHV